MARLEILQYPDPQLRTVASPVTSFDDSLRRLADNMLETMYAAPGVGLAATQVNVHSQFLVLDISEQHDAPRCLANPHVISSAGSQTTEEGCLSIPGLTADVERFDSLVIGAQDLEGEHFTLEAEGLLAICVQHEMDHLKGRLFVDYLSAMKRARLRKKIEKQKRRDAE